jgi:putative oxidoreductase
MPAFLRPYAPHAFALMRIIVGLLFMSHGLSKLFNWPAPTPPDAPAFVVYVGGVIELATGLLVAIGLFTRWAAFLASGMMAAAYWMAHGLNDWHPMLNQGELAAIYCFVFLFIAAHGPGIWSVDASRAERV